MLLIKQGLNKAIYKYLYNRYLNNSNSFRLYLLFKLVAIDINIF